MPAREPSRKKQQTQLQRIKQAHAKRAASRTLVREGGSARSSARASGGIASRRRGSASSGRYVVVRKRSGRIGGVGYEIIGYSEKKPRAGVPVPHGGLFTLGDPTLAKRVEEEIYRSEAR